MSELNAATELAPAPTLSIVIATRQAGSLAALLGSVAPTCREREAQLIVAAVASVELEEVQTRFPEVVVVSAPADADFAQLRELGANAASGDILILSDDTRPLPEEWLTIQ